MGSAGPRAFRTSRAFLVRAQDLGETDRRLVFFTEAVGPVTLVAKAARRSRRRFGGILQRFLLLRVEWTETPGRMGLLGQAAVERSFFEITGNIAKVVQADHLLDLAVVLFPQPGPKPKAFEILAAGIEAIASGEPPAAAARKTEAAMLAAGGWGPDLSGCRRCRERQSPWFRFVPPDGGLLCPRCGKEQAPCLSLGAVKTWRALQAAPPARLSRIRVPDAILVELEEVIGRYLEWHFAGALRRPGG